MNNEEFWTIQNKKDSKPIAVISPQKINVNKQFRIQEFKHVGYDPTGSEIVLNISNLQNSANDLIQILRLALK